MLCIPVRRFLPAFTAAFSAAAPTPPTVFISTSHPVTRLMFHFWRDSQRAPGGQPFFGNFFYLLGNLPTFGGEEGLAIKSSEPGGNLQLLTPL